MNQYQACRLLSFIDKYSQYMNVSVEGRITPAMYDSKVRYSRVQFLLHDVQSHIKSIRTACSDEFCQGTRMQNMRKYATHIVRSSASLLSQNHVCTWSKFTVNREILGVQIFSDDQLVSKNLNTKIFQQGMSLLDAYDQMLYDRRLYNFDYDPSHDGVP